MEWNEIKDLVLLALDKFKSNDHDEIIEYLANYYANHLFESLELDKDDAIPVSKLSNLILEGSTAAKMLLQICGSISTAADFFEDNNNKFQNNEFPNIFDAEN